MAAFGIAYVRPAQHHFALKDIQVEFSNQNSLAKTHFRVNGVVLVKGRNIGHQATLWEVTWRKEGCHWRITRVQQLHPLRGEPINQLKYLGYLPCD